ncbi:ribonuclease D [Motiliproteus coralliicola]|uniref:Ribonuclease D n=1 Tax=Motiliproteus coralliicola TaxID=2283196 RepID=A0A369WN56_9GAMM|nr:ribonuclease D [Motiliproteus coralliicola]RDE22653.1 ribonuclease D [Motiliproteus coralliicola]
MINQPLEEDQLQACRQAIDNAEWVDTDARLADLCRQWRQQDRVAIDTEFQRTDTFYPIPGLIQVGSEGQAFLIDPQSITNFSPLIELLNDEAVLKLVHAGSEDLELFVHSFGAVPKPLFDTQTACAFLGLGLSVGYQRLLSTLFGLEVDKQETRSDWLQRPLTESQCHYAAEDVVFLELIYQRLLPRLEAESKFDWVLEECGYAAAEALAPPQMDNYYLRFKQAWKLRQEQLSVLYTLSGWREREARERDMPRNFVLHNSSLQSIATRLPGSMGALSKVERIRGRTLSKDGKTLLELVKQGLERDDQARIPAPERPLPSRCGAQLKQLKALVNERAEVLDIAPELMVKRKDMEALVRSQLDTGEAVLPAGLQGWRQQVIGNALQALLNENNSETSNETQA